MSETVAYSVPAIHCAHCAMSIREEVSEVDGVEDVAVDLDTKIVTVQGMELDDADGFEATGPALPIMAPTDIVPWGQEFGTVGHLYRSIQAGLHSLADRLGDRALDLRVEDHAAGRRQNQLVVPAILDRRLEPDLLRLDRELDFLLVLEARRPRLQLVHGRLG